MSQRSLARALLTPSLLSGYATFFVACGLLGVGAWSYLTQGEFLHDYLFGPFGIVTAMLYAPDFFAVFRRTIVNNPATYNAFIVVAALLVGWLVYELLEALRRLANNTSMVWYEFHARTPQARQALTETLVRLVVRCVGATALVLYMVFLVNMLIPFCMLMIQNGIDHLASLPLLALGTFGASLLFLILSLHVNLVLIRLSLLRPRLFGGWAVQGD